MDTPKIEMKYKDVGKFEFSQVIQKIANTPTAHSKANHIRKVVNLLQDMRKKLGEEYQKDILEVYAQRDDKGQIVRPEGDPDSFIPIKEKEEEFAKAQEAFGERVGIIEWRPLNGHTLSDIKLSARELDLLGDLYSEEVGPGVPMEAFPNGRVSHLHN